MSCVLGAVLVLDTSIIQSIYSVYSDHRHLPMTIAAAGQKMSRLDLVFVEKYMPEKITIASQKERHSLDFNRTPQ